MAFANILIPAITSLTLISSLSDSAAAFSVIKFRCNNHGWLFINGRHAIDVHGPNSIVRWNGTLVAGDQILIKGQGPPGNAGCSADITYYSKRGHLRRLVTDTSRWKALPLGTRTSSVKDVLSHIPTSTWVTAAPGADSARLSDKIGSIFAGNGATQALLWSQLGSRKVTNPPGQVLLNCDDKGWLFINKRHVKDVNGPLKIAVWTGKLSPGDEVVIKGKDYGGGYGCNALVHYFENGQMRVATTSSAWKARSITEEVGKQKSEVFLAENPLADWENAVDGTYGNKIVDSAEFIWAARPHGSAFVGTTLPSMYSGSVTFRCVYSGWLFINGKRVVDVNGKTNIATWRGHLVEGDQVHIKSEGPPGGSGCDAKITYRSKDGSLRKQDSDTTHWKALPIGTEKFGLKQTVKRIPTSTWMKAVQGANVARLSEGSTPIFAGNGARRAILWTQLGSGPVRNPPGQVLFNCDDRGWLFINKVHAKDVHGSQKIAVWTGKLSPGDEIVIKGKDNGRGYGCNALVHYFEDGHLRVSATNKSWKARSLSDEEARKSSASVLTRNPLAEWTAADKGTYGNKIVDKTQIIWGHRPHGSTFIGTTLPFDKPKGASKS